MGGSSPPLSAINKKLGSYNMKLKVEELLKLQHLVRNETKNTYIEKYMAKSRTAESITEKRMLNLCTETLSRISIAMANSKVLDVGDTIINIKIY